MTKRLLSVAAVAFLLLLVACEGDDTTTAAAGAGTVTVQVDNETDDFNYEAISYYPNELTVVPGSTLKFHSNFEGEPHTVTFGDSVNQGLSIFAGLSEEEQNGPPPPEIEALKIPFVIPDDADFSDPASVQFNQSAAQPCVVKAGEFAPGAAPCPTKKAEAFDGTQALYNSGLMKADQNFEVKLADNIKPGVYQYVCLFHGPEMAGKVTVVAKGDAAAQDNAAVQAAGKQQLDDDVAKVKAALDEAKTKIVPGEVTAGAAPEESSAGAMEFIPGDASIPVGGSVTWNLSFHTVAFSAPEDARPDVVQDSDGTWHFNEKTFTPVGFTPPPPPAGGGGSTGPPTSDEPPPPTNIDGGTYNGSGFYNSGSFDVEGDLFIKTTFTKAGTYSYICLIHPDMKGTVKVG